jgi:hypothetical protein
MLKQDSKFKLLERDKSFSYNKSCSEIATFAELTATHAAPYGTSATAGCNRKWYFSQGAPQRCSFVVGSAYRLALFLFLTARSSAYT